MNSINEVKKKLSRYPVQELVSFLELESYKILGKSYHEIYKPKYIFPHFIETLAIIIISMDDTHKSIRSIQSKLFINDINDILRYINDQSFPPDTDTNEEIRLELLMNPITMQQFSYQIDYDAIEYRYTYIFTHTDTIKNSLFQNTGTNDFSVISFFFGLIPQLNSTSDQLLKNNLYVLKIILDLIFNKYPKLYKILSYDVKSILQYQDSISDINSIPSLLFSYRPIREKPIITKNNRTYFILPHCFTFACTDGLIISITENNENLKNHIGKEIMEDYINDIIRNTKMYDVAVPKIKYKYVNKYDIDPSDAVFKSGDTIVFLEFKFRTFKRKFSINNKESVKKEYEYMIGATEELLKSYIKYKEGYYKPFSTHEYLKNEFLIVSYFYYATFSRTAIIEELCKKDKYKEYKEFLYSHLLICDLATLESYFLYDADIIYALKDFSSKNLLDQFEMSKKNHLNKIVSNKLDELHEKYRNDYIRDLIEKVQKNNE